MAKFYSVIPMGRIGVLSFFLVCLLQAVQAQQTGVNIITNGDAETTPINPGDYPPGWAGTDLGYEGYADQWPWILPDTSSYAAKWVMHGAHGGKYFFSAGIEPFPSSTAAISQTINLNTYTLANQDLYFTFSGWTCTDGNYDPDFPGAGLGGDIVEIRVEYMSGATILHQYDWDTAWVAESLADVAWHNLVNTQHILATDNIDHVRITLNANHANQVNPTVIFYDDLSLVASTTLPVTLLDLSAVQKPDHTVELQWQTAQEQNSNYFEVQRSSNGKDFTPIGQVTAAGNSHTISNYSFVDRSPLGGSSFYRLKPVDLDGSFKYSRIVRVVTVASSQSIEVFSNPFHDQLGLRIAATMPDKLVFSLTDLSGRVCWQQTYSEQTGNNFVNLYPPAGMAAGMYLLQVKGAHTQQTIKVLKQ